MAKPVNKKTSDLAQRISKFREDRGWSQERLAQEMGISRNYVSMIEGGRVPKESVVKLFESLENSPIYRDGAGNKNPVRRAREAAGLTIRQLAKETGYKIGVLQALEEGRAQVSHKMADVLVKALPSLDRDELLRNDEHPPTIGVERAAVGTKPDLALPPGMTARYVPLISWAQAGELTGFEDEYEFEGHIAFDSKDPKAFAITIRGDSMEPQYASGDVVIVYPSRDAANGNLVVGKTRDGEVFFKRLTVVRPGEFRFSSYNPVYEPFDRAKTELRWLYPVASVTRHTL